MSTRPPLSCDACGLAAATVRPVTELTLSPDAAVWLERLCRRCAAMSAAAQAANADEHGPF